MESVPDNLLMAGFCGWDD